MDTDYHYGVVVGIDHYPGISPLQFARKDAIAFHEWLRKAGLTDDRLELVCLPEDATPPDRPEVAEPALRTIWFALRDKLLKVRQAIKDDPAAWPRTRLYFFFSGHGVAPRALDATGLSAEATMEDLGWGTSLRRLTEWLMDSGDFAEVVMIADCCRNKPTRPIEPAPPPFTPIHKTRSEEPSVATLYATIYGTAAREPKGREPDKERGYYTRALLEGLHGEPKAFLPDGTVTTGSLHKYARQRVKELTCGKQTPPKRFGDDIVLVEGLAPAPAGTRSVRIRFPDGFTGPATLQNGTFAPIGDRPPGVQEWVKDLQPALYKMVGGQFAENGRFEVPEGQGEFVVEL